MTELFSCKCLNATIRVVPTFAQVDVTLKTPYDEQKSSVNGKNEDHDFTLSERALQVLHSDLGLQRLRIAKSSFAGVQYVSVHTFFVKVLDFVFVVLQGSKANMITLQCVNAIGNYAIKEASRIGHL